MDTFPDSRQTLWQEITHKIEEEWKTLSGDERSWITVKINRLAEVQQQLHHIVSCADGEEICRNCAGACCGHGLYHPTLVTVLAHLVLNHPLPVPDFTQSCPYFGVKGCQFLPVVRPYNCLIFICELIEERFSEDQRQSMLSLELELREVYMAFDRRYSGSSLRGLLNRTTERSFQPFLDRQDVLI